MIFIYQFEGRSVQIVQEIANVFLEKSDYYKCKNSVIRFSELTQVLVAIKLDVKESGLFWNL